jgi:type I restriction enzyme S subunit
MTEGLPTGWVKTTLGEIVKPSRERALPSEVPEMKYVGLEHIEAHTMKLLGHGQASQVRSSSLRFSRGDVLYGKMRPYLNKVWLATFGGICSAEFLVFPRCDGLNIPFLAFRLNAEDFVTYANGQVSGERPRVDFEKLSPFPILLPPAAEAERIVTKLNASLSRLERAEMATRRALEKLQRYRASILEAAWRGKWPRRKLGELTQKIGSGSTPRGGEAVYQESGIPLIRSLNVHSTGFRLEGLVFIDEVNAKKLGNAVVAPGDVLLNITGASIGRVTTVPASLGGARVNQHVCIIRPSDELLSEFLAMFLASPSEQARIRHVQVGATRQALTKAMIVNWEVPVPPLSQQSKIVAKAKRQLSVGARMIASLEQQLDRARATRQSLLREAFAGRLVPQDPKDEQASVLLDRIRAARKAEAKKQKGKRMRKLKLRRARRPLLEVLREHNKPMSPEQLYREAGFQPEEVDVFYRELASLRIILREQKPSASEVKGWPHRAHVLLELKER